jgi:hypothetical protein
MEVIANYYLRFVFMKMKKNLITIFAYFTFLLPILAQKNWFNTYPYDPLLVDSGRAVFQEGTNLYVFTHSQLISPSWSRITVFKINMLGEIVWRKYYDEPEQGIDVFQSVTKLKDGNFVILGVEIEEPQHTFALKISKENGEMIWKTVFENNENYNTPVSVSELPNQNIVCMIDEFDVIHGTTYARKVLLTLDKEGKLLSRKIVKDLQNKYSSKGSFFIYNNDFVVSASTWATQPIVPQQAFSCMKSDSSGKILWQKRYHLHTGRGFGDGIIKRLNDSTALVFSERYNEGAFLWYAPVLLKINTNTGELIHEKVFDQIRWFSDFIVAPDGNIICVGREESDQAYTWLCKMTPNGEFIWTRQYLAPNEKNKDNATHFSSLTLLDDNRIAITGDYLHTDSLGTPDGRYMCLTIVDGNGCFNKDCSDKAQILAVPFFIPYNQTDATVFPNPSNNLINLHFKEGIEGKVVLSNMTGQALSVTKITLEQLNYNIPLTQYPNGTYFLHIIENNRKQTAKKIIIQH